MGSIRSSERAEATGRPQSGGTLSDSLHSTSRLVAYTLDCVVGGVTNVLRCHHRYCDPGARLS
jgi:hypothetical protein